MKELNSKNRKLYLWLNQALYLGVLPVARREYAVLSDRLIVSLQGNIQITTENGEKITSRTCLVKAGINLTKSNVNTSNAVIATYYFAPLTQDYSALESIMCCAANGLHYNHPEEENLVKALLKLRETAMEPDQAFTILRKIMIPPHLANHTFKEYDERIVKVVHRIRETASENLSLRKLAEGVNLSESRLEKLFKDQLGIPITKYRLRYRVALGIIHLALGKSITRAALAAGFASSSHFSKSYSAINGIPPSDTFCKKPYLNVLISDEVLNKPKKRSVG